MPKIFVKVECKLPIIHDGKDVIAKVPKGSIVEVKEIDWKDVKDGFYSPVKESIVGPDGNKIKRVRPKMDSDNTITLAKEIRDITGNLITVMNKLNNVILSLSGDGPQEPVQEVSNLHESEYVTMDDIENNRVYTSNDLKNHMNKVKNIIVNNMVDDKDHSLGSDFSLASKLPLFSEERFSQFTPQGEIEIIDEMKIKGMDILDQTPVSLNVIKNDTGSIDVIKSLGMHVINPK